MAEIITKYRDVKNKIPKINLNASIVDCPYYSLTEWNRLKGCKDITVYQTADKELGSVVFFYNQEIKNFNNNPTPRLFQDIIRSSKPKKSKHVKYTKKLLFIFGRCTSNYQSYGYTNY